MRPEYGIDPIMDVLAAERDFFSALTMASPEALEHVLGDDFLLIDFVGGTSSKAPFMVLIGSGQLVFDEIERDPDETLIRLFGTIAVVTGRTRMKGHLGGTAFSVGSRHTHVYAARQGRWTLVSAQGTQIL
jgi:Domain of unknown function (DUF4440)